MVKRGRNKITSLRRESGEWVTEIEELRNMLQDYYSFIFKPDSSWEVDMKESGSFPMLFEEIFSSLNAPYSETEIKQALFDMAPFKAPGPDGLPAGFFRKTWKMMGKSI